MKIIGLQVEITPTKYMQIRLSLCITSDAGNVEFTHYHRFPPMPPGTNLDEWRLAIENNIASPNSGIPFAPWPAIPDAEWNEVKSIQNIVHTPARKAAFLAAESARLEAEARRLGNRPVSPS